MNKLQGLLNDKIRANSAYYYRDELLFPEQQEQTTNCQLIIAAAHYVYESKTFFNIEKKKELSQAVAIFVRKHAPFDAYYHWYEVIPGEGGSFVIVYYIRQAHYQAIIQRQADGGIVLPEQLIVRQHSEQLCVDIVGEGGYVSDTNYRAQYVTANKTPFAQLIASGQQVEIDAFYNKLIASLSWSDLLPYVRHIHRGKHTNTGLKVKHLLAGALIAATYFGGTSAYLHFEYAQSQAQYEKNKELLQQLKRSKRQLKDIQAELVQKNQPFEDYLYSYSAFQVLEDVTVFYEIQSFTINNEEITVNGVSDNAASIFKTLSNQEEIKDLRYVRPVRKSGTQDAFTIAFKLVSKT